MIKGIYKIINLINNKFYVGSAVNFARRKARHLSDLRKGGHPNKHLQSAWNKYGEKAFIFVMVEEVASRKDVLRAENRWLKKHVGEEYCYNVARDATAPQLGNFGVKNPMWGKTFSHTEEAKRRIGIASKARIQSEGEKAKRRATMKGREVSIETRIKISQTLMGEGNYWYGKKRPDHGGKVSKAVLVTQPDGGECTFDSILQLREALGLKPTTVNRALKSGKVLVRGPYKGWRFKYLDSAPKQE